jgi:putative endonuclease
MGILEIRKFNDPVLRKRFKQHNSGESLATKSHKPYKLIFYEAFSNRIDAKNREIYLKSGYGRKSMKILLREYFLGK